MHAFEVLGDPVRRRILEVLATGDHLSGDLAVRMRDEFDISAPAVSQHLKVLRESGFATVAREGSRRRYAVAGDPFADVEAWLSRFRAFWSTKLDALELEIARGQEPRSAERRDPPHDDEK